VAGPIVLLTDFGLDDAYVGTMKGVILGVNPRATIVDLCHQVPPQNVAEGALLLAESYRYFPADSIFVAVVDPGVGSARRPIALRSPHGTFVGPDNGLFGGIARDFGVIAPPAGGRARLAGSYVAGVTLANAQYFLPRVSATFHGRDVFAPVAAHLSLGVALTALGPALSDLEILPSPAVERRPGELIGHVARVDRFGNAITDLVAADLAPFASPVVEVAGQQIVGISHHYAQRAGLIALVSSSDRLEIAVSGGNAAAALGLRAGDPVRVREGGTS
jgi:S-adenosylmethionine hydrolase